MTKAQYAVLRREAERAVVLDMFTAAIEQGWTIDGASGGDMRSHATTIEEAMAYVFDLDECHVYFMKPGAKRQWVYFVLGNDGWDVVADYTLGFEAVISATEPTVEKWENRLGGIVVKP